MEEIHRTLAFLTVGPVDKRKRTRVDSRPRFDGWLNANPRCSSLTTQCSGRNSPIVQDRRRPPDTLRGRLHKACLLPLSNCAESARGCGTDTTPSKGRRGKVIRARLEAGQAA